MPPRGTPSLWPVRIFTDFGKAALVLWALVAMLFAVALISPRLRGTPRSLLLRFGTHLQFLFFAVLVPVLSGEVIKWIVGRGRPFVGGEANAFNFAHFAGTEAYASFPSAHAITSFALAFAVAAVWPQARIPMIALCRLDRGQPARAAGPSSERRGGGRIDRRGRCDGRAVLVRGPPSGVRDRPRRRIAPLRDLAGGSQKGCPRGVSPIRSGRRNRRTHAGPAVGQLKPMSVDLPSSDTAAVAVSIVVPVRNEAENVAPVDRGNRRRARRPMGL